MKRAGSHPEIRLKVKENVRNAGRYIKTEFELENEVRNHTWNIKVPSSIDILEASFWYNSVSMRRD